MEKMEKLPSSIALNEKARNLKPYALNKHSFPILNDFG
jgi:hypothetical protein